MTVHCAGCLGRRGRSCCVPVRRRRGGKGPTPAFDPGPLLALAAQPLQLLPVVRAVTRDETASPPTKPSLAPCRLESTASTEGPRASARHPTTYKIVSFPLKFEEPPWPPGPWVGQQENTTLLASAPCARHVQLRRLWTGPNVRSTLPATATGSHPWVGPEPGSCGPDLLAAGRSGRGPGQEVTVWVAGRGAPVRGSSRCAGTGYAPAADRRDRQDTGRRRTRRRRGAAVLPREERTHHDRTEARRRAHRAD